MKLWLLRPINGAKEWKSWYDKAFGHVVRAEDETEARELAASERGDEGRNAWLDNKKSTCVELSVDGKEEHIIRDFAAA